MSEDDDNNTRIRSAASLLVKGGTLTSEPCPKCGGVQVRFADKTTCINCGNEIKKGAPPKTKGEEKISSAHASTGLAAAASIIEEKIVVLAAEIKSEDAVLLQRQKADLLEIYLRILEKTRSLI
jgi:UPF0148 protein